MFQRNPFHQYSDESVDERNRLLLTTECYNKKDNPDYPFIVSNLLRMSHLNACIHILERKKLLTLHQVIYDFTVRRFGDSTSRTYNSGIRRFFRRGKQRR